MSLRNLLRIASRVGRPGTLLELKDAGGATLYLTAAMQPVDITVALERGDVLQLQAALSQWLLEREDRPPAGYDTGTAVPLVAGRIGAGLRDVSASTVQFCTVDPRGDRARQERAAERRRELGPRAV